MGLFALLSPRTARLQAANQDLEQRVAHLSQEMNHLRGGYAAARLNRYAAFAATLEAAHKERLRDLTLLRAHSRELAKDNAYMKRFVDLVSTHVVGPEGITFESEILNSQKAPKEAWNDQIESAWQRWGKCVTADERLSWVAFQQLVIETIAIDGETLVRLVRGRGPFGLQLELIDADRLDHRLNTPFQNGKRIVMGVEMDTWGKRLAYHIWSAHPGDAQGMPRRERVPADDILHLYVEDRAQGVRGIPWSTSVMVHLNMLARLWTSSLAAANAEADRLGIVKGAGDLLPGQKPTADPQKVAHELSSEMLTFLGLDHGLEVTFPPLLHPHPILPDFSRFLLKGASAGLGVSYHSLAGDVSDANYSSSRVALLDERDMWKKRQRWLVESFHEKLYRVWLEMALLTDQVNLPFSRFQTLCADQWWARSWDWVDPEKDANASLKAVDGNLSTYQQELGARGQDWREVFRQRKAEQDYANQIGLILRPLPATASQGTC